MWTWFSPAAALVFYPTFSATVVGLILAAAKDAKLLFRLLMLFAVWLILSSVWGIRRTAERPAGGATVSP